MSAKEQRDNLDEAILKAIHGGTSRAGTLETIAKELGEKDPMRATDRSLQRLRRAGKIAYSRSLGWTVEK